AAEPSVVRERGSGTQRIAEAELERTGVDTARLRVVAQLSGIDAIKAAVEAGLGIAIVSALAVRREVEHGTLVALRVGGAPMDRRLAAAFASGRAVLPAAGALLRLVRAAGLPPRVRPQRPLPGLIDADAHVGVSFPQPTPAHGAEPLLAGTLGHVLAAELREVLRMGITTMRDVGSMGDLVVEARQAMRYGAFRGPRLLTCG